MVRRANAVTGARRRAWREAAMYSRQAACSCRDAACISALRLERCRHLHEHSQRLRPAFVGPPASRPAAPTFDRRCLAQACRHSGPSIKRGLIAARISSARDADEVARKRATRAQMNNRFQARRQALDDPLLPVTRSFRGAEDKRQAAGQSSSSVGQGLLNKCQRSALFGSGASPGLTHRPPRKLADDSFHTQAELCPPCRCVWMTPWAHPSQPLMVSAMTLVEMP